MSKKITIKQATAVARSAFEHRSVRLPSTEIMVEQALNECGFTIGQAYADGDDERTIGNLTKWIRRYAKPITD